MKKKDSLNLYSSDLKRTSSVPKNLSICGGLFKSALIPDPLP